jgi:hypothetical protein
MAASSHEYSITQRSKEALVALLTFRSLPAFDFQTISSSYESLKKARSFEYLTAR